ncbi:hypothetical protein P152DRAFT_334054 [Eremomyces bilateralis CBS 781.70]|uniref:Uncharacterized protein n=1 Tax=Eremomyces bilateralis CBS 781.70 TaxID=1392243 RepID=A0A6G1G4H9_9PEZI|nr:uncharacterized protein P152DRAFT_334054 [Eremomyces bilateralis CBS 781.70]KAF1812995.1 hypothetical protein P152DRAFT_334054 [Eremomyces bilateralis CBS 781.70]
MPTTTPGTNLYGTSRPKKLAGNELSGSSNLAFTSQLSSLISASSRNSSSATAGRSRPRKPDIFSAHNKGVKRRAQADDAARSLEQKHSTSSEGVDAELWRQSQAKMEEKARIYAAMKRGDKEDKEEGGLIDFDRKWVESQERGEKGSSGDEDDEEDEEEELVEYVDEFGRTRKGTRAEVGRIQRMRRIQDEDEKEADRFTARPMMPEKVIHGDTVQYHAFDPDETVAEKMARLAAKRDKEATPPPDTHFDASREIRQKGQGFFQFAQDEEARQKQMGNLEKERKETEQAREEARERKEKRKREVEERRKEIRGKRARKEADQFLEELGAELGAPAKEEG